MFISKYSYITCLIFYFLSAYAAFGQIKSKGIPFIKNYTFKDYNASPQNWAIVQDNRGLMYFGNNYGYLEFDGQNWKLIGIQNKTIVRSLAKDENGKIYVGGQGDFGYLQPDIYGEMMFVSLKPKIDEQYQNFNDVWKIYITPSGVTFCTSSALYVYNYKTIQTLTFHTNDLGFPYFVNETLFIPILGEGIYVFSDTTLKFIPESVKVKNFMITGVLPYNGKEVLLVTEEDGIFIYDGEESISEWRNASEFFFKSSNIATVLALPEGYAIGSSNNGLLIMDFNGNPLQHLNREKGLQNSAIQSIFLDKAGNLWLGLNNGIDYIELNSPFSLYNSKAGIPGTAYTSLISDGKVFFGTNEGLYVKIWDKEENAIQSPSSKLIENSQGQVYNLQSIKGKLLLSHHHGPYEIIDHKAQRISDHYGIWMFMELKNNPGYLLCGTYSGLLLYKLHKDLKVEFLWKIDGFNESSRIIEQDEEGNIWIAHGYKGMYKLKLSPELDKVLQVKFYDNEHGFPSNLFINVFKVKNKLIFTGETGIYNYNKEIDRFEINEELTKLFGSDKHIRKIIEDKEGNIWVSMGTELGVLRKHYNGNYEIEKSVFNKLEGRLPGGFEHIAFYDNKNVLIGIDEGFVHFDPSYSENNNSAKTFHTRIRKVENTNIKQDSVVFAGSFFDGNSISLFQSSSEIPTFPFQRNSLRFGFGAVSFDYIEKMQYQYFLEGFDKDWSAWTSLTMKEYTNLREGAYTFHVKAKDIYENESTLASYQFAINPPWYRSFGSYILYLILGIGIVYLLKISNDRSVHTARERLKEEQEKALKLKEAQHMEEVLKSEREIIKLNNEKLENELVHKAKELTSSAMHVMHSIETIQKIKEQLQEVYINIKDKEVLQHIKKVLKDIDSDIKFQNNWEQFEIHFNQIHQDFLFRLRNDFPQLTHRDIKLCAYLRLSLSSKEIASLLNLSIRGVEATRYRIRKKMNLDQEINLVEFILKY